VFEPGTLDPRVLLGTGTARVAICADAQRAEHAAAAAAAGAGTYLVGAFLVPSAWEAEAGVLRQRATEHGMLVATANYGAPSGGLAAEGRSSIWDERGELVLALEASGAGVGIAWETDDGGWSGSAPGRRSWTRGCRPIRCRRGCRAGRRSSR
jgi:predicted amidohydrolase